MDSPRVQQSLDTATLVLHVHPQQTSDRALTDSESPNREIGPDQQVSRCMNSHKHNLFASAPNYNTTVSIENLLSCTLKKSKWDVTPSVKAISTVEAGATEEATVEAEAAAFGTEGMMRFTAVVGGNTVYLWFWFSCNSNHKVAKGWTSYDSVIVQTKITSRTPFQVTYACAESA